MMGMGFGLMGAGSAVKGLVSGYQQGRKFAQDEERFEIEKEEAGQRKRLREGQIESVGLANRKAKGELDDEDQWRKDSDEIAALWKGLFPSEPTPGIKSAPTVENKAPAQTLSQPAASAPPQLQNLPVNAATPPAARENLPVTPSTPQGSVEPMLGGPRVFQLPPRGFTVPSRSGIAAPPQQAAPAAAATTSAVSAQPPARRPEPAAVATTPAAAQPQPAGDEINRAAWMSYGSVDPGGASPAASAPAGEARPYRIVKEEDVGPDGTTTPVDPKSIDPNDSNYDPGPVGAETPSTGPVFTVNASPDAPKGITPPGGTPIPSRGPSLAQMEEFYSKANAIAIRRIMRKDGPAAAVKMAIDMGRAFGDAKVDAGIRALNLYDGSNDDVVRAELEKAGLPVPEGTRFERKEVEVIPGSGFKSTDVIATSPDGKMTRSLHGLMAARMSPKEVFDRDTALGKAAAEIALKKTAEENLQTYRTQDLQLKRESAAAQANYYLQMLAARTKEIGFQADARGDANDARKALNEARAEEARSRASRNALGEIMQLNGISRETSAKDMEMLSDDDRLRVQSGLARSFTAHTIWSMNLGKISPAESMEVGRRVALDPKAVKRDEAGQAFIQFGGKQVFVPSPAGAAPPAAGTDAGAPKPPPAEAKDTAPRPGIAPPRSGQLQLSPEAEQAGVALEAARKRAADASAALQRYGSRQQQQDPSGYNSARQAAAAAKADLEKAESAYQAALSPGLTKAFSR